MTVTIAFTLGKVDRQGQYWIVSPRTPHSSAYRALLRLNRDDLSIVDRYVLPIGLISPTTRRFRDQHWAALADYRCTDFTPVLALALGASLDQALAHARSFPNPGELGELRSHLQ